MKIPFLSKNSQHDPEGQPSNSMVLLALGVLSAIAAGLSLWVFSKSSLRLDEAQSLFQTNRNLSGLLKLVAQDVHVPLYHILLQGWQRLFGGDIVVARLLSLLFYILTIIATYKLGAYAYKRKVGLYAALLVTISPFMAWYGSEARMYSMLAFITVVNQLYFLKIRREDTTKNWLIYGLTAIVGIYTHYFFSFVLIAEGLYFLLRRKTFEGKRTLLKFMAVAITTIAAFTPWLYYVYSLGTASNTQPNLPSPSSGDLFDTYAQFIFGFQVEAVNTIIVSLWPVIVLLAFFALQKRHKLPTDTAFFVMAAVFPVLAAFIISITLRPFYLSRYLIVALPALFIFISWIFSDYPKRLRRILQSGLVVLILMMLLVQTFSPQTPVKENYAEAVGYLNEQTTSQDIIIASAPFTIYPIEYYYRGNAKLTTQPVWDRFNEGSIPPFDEKKLAEEAKQARKSYQRAWVVLSFDQGYNKEIKDYYDSHYERLTSKNFSRGLNIYSYKLRYDEPLMITPIEAPKE